MAGHLAEDQIAIRIQPSGRGERLHVDQGQIAVLLVDGGQVGVAGPGALDEFTRECRGRRVEVVICEARNIELAFTYDNLRSEEGARIELTCHAQVRIDAPQRFVSQLLGSAQSYTRAQLHALLATEVAAVLRSQIARYSLDRLAEDLTIRARVETTLEAHFRQTLDLLEGNGLRLSGIKTPDYRCRVLEEQQEQQHYLYLQLSREEAELQHRQRMADLAGQRLVVEAKEAEIKVAQLLQNEAVLAAYDHHRARLAATRKSVHEGRAVPAAPSSRGELWQAQAPGSIYGPVALTAEHVLAGYWNKGNNEGGVLWLDRHDGKQVHLTPLPGGVEGGVVVDERRAIVAVRDGAVAVLDIDSRRLIQEPVAVGGLLRSTPLLHEGVIYVSSDQPGFVAAILPHARTTRSRWPAPGGVGVRSTPMMLGRFLYFAVRNGQLCRVDPQGRGQPEAFGPALQPYFLGSPAGDSRRGHVYVTCSDRRCYALDERGALLWRDPFQGQGQFSGTPLLVEDTLYAGCHNGRLYAIDAATGRERWKLPVNGAIAATPAAWQELLFVGCNDGHLYAIRRSAGLSDSERSFWKFSAGAPIFAKPTIDEETGVLYFGDESGGVYAVPWHRGNYVKAAKYSRELNLPEQAGDMLILAGDPEEARACYRQAGLHEQAASIAEQEGHYAGAAKDYQRAGKWLAAALAWRMAGNQQQEWSSRERHAKDTRGPLLSLTQLTHPAATLGDEIDMLFEVRNMGHSPARDIALYAGGHIQRPVEMTIRYLAPGEAQRLVFHVSPSASGASRVVLQAVYRDRHDEVQLPVTVEATVVVTRPAVEQHIYQAPVYRIGGDGVIIVRPGALGGDRQIIIQEGDG